MPGEPLRVIQPDVLKISRLLAGVLEAAEKYDIVLEVCHSAIGRQEMFDSIYRSLMASGVSAMASALLTDVHSSPAVHPSSPPSSTPSY